MSDPQTEFIWGNKLALIGESFKITEIAQCEKEF